MSEADDRYLAEVAEDCRSILGDGIDLLELRLERGGDVRLIARYRLGEEEWESTGAGETAIAAHADLRASLTIDRLRLGYSVLVGRTS
jgi:hypothetical protein